MYILKLGVFQISYAYFKKDVNFFSLEGYQTGSFQLAVLFLFLFHWEMAHTQFLYMFLLIKL